MTFVKINKIQRSLIKKWVWVYRRRVKLTQKNPYAMMKGILLGNNRENQ